MLRTLAPSDRAGARITIAFEGRPLELPAGSNLAAGLLAAGVTAFRYSSISGAPRGPHCMMGVCFECLVEVDGVPGQQACMIAAVPGMDVRRDRGSGGR